MATYSEQLEQIDELCKSLMPERAARFEYEAEHMIYRTMINTAQDLLRTAAFYKNTIDSHTERVN